MGRELLQKEMKIRILATNIHRDLTRLQVAMLKGNQHDISTHLGSAIERSDELSQITSDGALAIAQ